MGNGRLRRGEFSPSRNVCYAYFCFSPSVVRYFSPYPLTDTEVEDVSVAQGSASTSHPRIPGVQKTTARSHGRTSDLLAGGLGRAYAGEKAMLWVCQQCFKYMADGHSYDLHLVGFPHLSHFVFIMGHRNIVQ